VLGRRSALRMSKVRQGGRVADRLTGKSRHQRHAKEKKVSAHRLDSLLRAKDRRLQYAEHTLSTLATRALVRETIHPVLSILLNVALMERLSKWIRLNSALMILR
jgi:hypothetical protein